MSTSKSRRETSRRTANERKRLADLRARHAKETAARTATFTERIADLRKEHAAEQKNSRFAATVLRRTLATERAAIAAGLRAAETRASRAAFDFMWKNLDHDLAFAIEQTALGNIKGEVATSPEARAARDRVAERVADFWERAAIKKKEVVR